MRYIGEVHLSPGTLPSEPKKIRPFNFLGQLFLRTPGIMQPDGSMWHILTPNQIYDGLKDIPEICNNCAEGFTRHELCEEVFRYKRLNRLSVWISNYTVIDGSWNGKHGGAIITAKKLGQTVQYYILETPDRLDVFGRVMHNTDDVRINEATKLRIQADAGPAFPGMHNTIVDKDGRVVPNDPNTGEPLMKFWEDQNVELTVDLKEEKEVPKEEEETPPDEQTEEEKDEQGLKEITEETIAEEMHRQEEEAKNEPSSDKDEGREPAPDEVVGDTLVVSETKKPQTKKRSRPVRKNRAA